MADISGYLGPSIDRMFLISKDGSVYKEHTNKSSTHNVSKKSMNRFSNNS